MARICAVVQNSVSRDARVLKEARTLVEAGHDLTIVGVSDAYNREPETILGDGTRIIRIVVPSRPPKSQLLYRLFSYLGKSSRLLGTALILCLLIAGWNMTWPERLELIYVGAIIAVAIFTGWEFWRLLSSQGGRKLIKHGRELAASLLGWLAPGLLNSSPNFQRRVQIMAEAVLRTDPDIVHCHDVHTLPVGARVKQRLGCQIVYDAHEIYEDLAQGNEATARRYRYLHRKHLHIVDRFITINQSIAGWYAQNYPSLPPATILMNATPIGPSFKYDGRMHKVAGLPVDAKILLYQGGYATKRGLDYIVRAAEFFPEDWTLVMMGWGRLEPHLHAIADDIISRVVRAPPVRFIPPAPQDELMLWTAGATIGVIPYEQVGLNHLYCTPNKLWEYPNAGVPVLVSPFPELRKPVELYGHGWLLPESQEPKALAHQLAMLTDAEITTARKACQTFIKEENWSKYATDLVALYDELLCLPDKSVAKAGNLRNKKVALDA